MFVKNLPFVVQKQLNSYPKQFIKSYMNFYQDSENHLRNIKNFEKKYSGNSGCVCEIKFVNTKTQNTIPFQFCLDLNHKDWFKSLCIRIGAKDITTENGESIEGFTRSDFIKHQRIFYVNTPFNKSSFVVPYQYNINKSIYFHELWTNLLKMLRNTVGNLIVNKTLSGELSKYINSGEFEDNFILYTKAYLMDKSVFHKYGCSGLDDFINEFTIYKGDSISDVIEYLFNHICLPLKFCLISEKENLGNHIQNFFGRKTVSLSRSSHEQKEMLKSFFLPTISKIFSPYYKEKVVLKTIKDLKSPCYIEIIEKTKGYLVDSQKPKFNDILKDVCEIKIPYHIKALNSFIHPKDLITEISGMPLTIHHNLFKDEIKLINDNYVISQLEKTTNCNCGKHIYFFIDKNGKRIFDKECGIVHNELKVHKNSQGKILVEIPSIKYNFFDPHKSELYEKNGTITKFKEVFYPNNNTHIFITKQ